MENHLVISSPLAEYNDSYIRKTAIKYNVPYITTISTALASVKEITKRKVLNTTERKLQNYHKSIS